MRLWPHRWSGWPPSVGRGSVPRSTLPAVPTEHVPWTEAAEVAAIAEFDVGIMPLADEPWERGKCGYKLIQYMACGLPVVASPVGVNRQIVEHGVNGFLAETPTQWDEALRTLLADPALRQRMGQAGRQKVERQFSLQVTGPKVGCLACSGGACLIKRRFKPALNKLFSDTTVGEPAKGST